MKGSNSLAHRILPLVLVLVLLATALASACAGYMSTILWLYAVRSYQLAGKRLGSIYIRRGYIINLIAPIIFTLSIGVAFINDDLATYIWMSTLVFYIVAVIVFKMPRLDDSN